MRTHIAYSGNTPSLDAARAIERYDGVAGCSRILVVLVQRAEAPVEQSRYGSVVEFVFGDLPET